MQVGSISIIDAGVASASGGEGCVLGDMGDGSCTFLRVFETKSVVDMDVGTLMVSCASVALSAVWKTTGISSLRQMSHIVLTA
jgi:ABC-type arginine transport system ATPase subunit